MVTPEDLAARRAELAAKRTVDAAKAETRVASSEYFESTPAPGLVPLTLCVLTLSNGFTAVGKAFAEEPATQEELRSRAREDAISRLIELEAFLLKQPVSSVAKPASEIALRIFAAHAAGQVKPEAIASEKAAG